MASSSSVKPAYSLKQAHDVTLRAILNPEIRESGDTDDTPVIKVWATTLLAPPLWLHRNLKESAGAGNRPEQFQILRENTVGKIVIFVNHQAE